MTDITLEQRARELLAAECRTRRYSFTADNLDEGNFPSIPGHVAIAAVAEALRLSAGADWIPAAKYPDDGNGDDDSYNAGWNACRSAMLAAAPRHETGEG